MVTEKLKRLEKSQFVHFQFFYFIFVHIVDHFFEIKTNTYDI